jgi:hypothetical protein
MPQLFFSQLSLIDSRLQSIVTPLANTPPSDSDVLKFIKKVCADMSVGQIQLSVHENAMSRRFRLTGLMEIKLTFISTRESPITKRLATIHIDADELRIECSFKKYFKIDNKLLFMYEKYYCKRQSIETESENLYTYLQGCIKTSEMEKY